MNTKMLKNTDEFIDLHRKSLEGKIPKINSQYDLIKLSICIAGSIAYAIKKSKLKSKVRNKLNILIVGAESMDSIFEGEVLQLIPGMLDRKKLEVDITMIGPNVRPPEGLEGFSGFKKAYFFDGLLSEYIDAYSIDDVDLAIFFSPYFHVEHEHWLFEGGLWALRELVNSGISIVGACRNKQERDSDIQVLEYLGFNINSTTTNPLSFDMGPIVFEDIEHRHEDREYYEEFNGLEASFGKYMYFLSKECDLEKKVNIDVLSSFPWGRKFDKSRESLALTYGVREYYENGNAEQMYWNIMDMIAHGYPIEIREAFTHTEEFEIVSNRAINNAVKHIEMRDQWIDE